MNSNYEEHRRKRRKIDGSTSTSTNNRRGQLINDQIRWKSSAEQQTYSTKLIDALRQVRLHHAPTGSGTTLRAAADKALAMAARGRTRWSRAILSTRLKLRRKNHRKVKIRSKIPPPPPPPMTAEKSTTAPVEKRVKVLGRLVPGCRKLSLPNLLEETSDYIAALQMQVRAMTALAQLLSGSPSSAGSINAEPAVGLNNVDDDPVH
ncbi:hypothetical protein RND81_04G226000 [Saponaria officinalis]|uniref:BHLH domain-containing protein n=1 Tax=Saponaria officinalis TaxID=3572 RepID=A0AAW1LG76_SAPOF